MIKGQKRSEAVWRQFVAEESLGDDQCERFALYLSLLQSWNEKFSLTAISSASGIIRSHFADSLVLRRFVDMETIGVIVDVGAGAGFPSIPLKIAFPHLGIILLEVNRKRQQFLNELIAQLNLDCIEVCTLDWRTFLRTTEGQADLFVARASLQPEELIRVFRGGSFYRNAQLVYWASQQWEPSKRVVPYIIRTEHYTIHHKGRKLVFMGLTDKSLGSKKTDEKDLSNDE